MKKRLGIGFAVATLGLLALWGCRNGATGSGTTSAAAGLEEDICLDQPVGPSVVIAHITDPHFWDEKGRSAAEDEGCLNQAIFSETIDRINEEHDASPIDFVAITGDIGIEKLIERTGINCKATRSIVGPTLFNEEQDGKIRAEIAKEAQVISDKIRASKVKDWVFVSGNNDLCNEDTRTVQYYDYFVAQMAEDLASSGVRIINLMPKETDYVGTYSPPNNPKHVFIGLENGSFKNNHDPFYASDEADRKGINTDFQKRTLDRLAEEITRQEQQQKVIHLMFHVPHFDDPFNASKANDDDCTKRVPTNLLPYQSGTVNCESTPKIATNDPLENINSAWLVPDAFRQRWYDLVEKDSIRTLIAGHFHHQETQAYGALDCWQTEEYPALVKYDVASPVSVKNQTIGRFVEQARGFTLLRLYDDGQRQVQRWWTAQWETGCNAEAREWKGTAWINGSIQTCQRT